MEFTYESGREMSPLVKGKTVKRVETLDDGSSLDDYLIIHFQDGSALHIRYDFVYEWELKLPTEKKDG